MKFKVITQYMVSSKQLRNVSLTIVVCRRWWAFLRLSSKIKITQHTQNKLALVVFFHGHNVLVKSFTMLCSSLTSPRMGGKKAKSDCRKLICRDYRFISPHCTSSPGTLPLFCQLIVYIEFGALMYLASLSILICGPTKNLISWHHLRCIRKVS